MASPRRRLGYDTRAGLEGPYATVIGPEFDVAPDAQRFLLLREPDHPPATEIVLVTNWFEELKRLAPTGGN